MADARMAELLADLHRKLIETLLARIKNGDAKAAELMVARQVLRYNNISTDPQNLDEQEQALQQALAGLDMELPQ